MRFHGRKREEKEEEEGIVLVLNMKRRSQRRTKERERKGYTVVVCSIGIREKVQNVLERFSKGSIFGACA